MVYEWLFPEDSIPRRVSLRPASTAIAMGAEQVMSFDGEGRLLTAAFGDRTYKRGLDHRVLEKGRDWAIGRHARLRRDLDKNSKVRLVAAVRETITQLLAALPDSASPEIRPRLERLLLWDDRAYAEDSRRFQEVYRPVGILPPDQYLALALQATEGCHHNRCLFCTFYRDQPFHIKSDEEFREHVTSARAFFGKGIGLRRTIFLGEANALVIPQSRLIALFNVLHEQFEVAPHTLSGRALAQWKASHPRGMTGVYAFLDAFTGKRRTEEEFRALAELGLRRVYIGMESGHIPLLEWLNKPSMPDDVLATISAAKAAGVAVAPIILLGVGGRRYADGHVADTIAVLNRLPLDGNDLVYLSEFVEEPGSPYESAARAASIEPLPGEELAAQAAAIRNGLCHAARPRIGTYDIREFIY